jgi:hypothetical protein
MSDSPVRRLYWSVVDALGYLVTLAWLHILDAVASSEPETPADAPLKLRQTQTTNRSNALKRSHDHCLHRTYTLLELNFTSGKVTSPSVNMLASCSIFAPSIKPAVKRSLSISRL